MKLILMAGPKGSQLVLEVDHRWMMVGYGQRPGAPSVSGTVAVEYEASQTPHIMRVCRLMQGQKRVPKVAIEGTKMQISYTVEPLTDDIRMNLSNAPLLSAVADEVRALSITSIGEAFPEDEDFKIFRRCLERDKSYDFVIMPPSTDVSGIEHVSPPLVMLRLREVGDKLELFQ